MDADAPLTDPARSSAGTPAATTPNTTDSPRETTSPADRPPVDRSVAGWLRENGAKLLMVGVIVALICRFLHPVDVFLAGLGLSLIIFIHELGHFLAAKWCKVYVKTFSIGFGPSLPFCSVQYGETTYKLGMIPLGGYVAMAGEADGNNGEIGTEETEAEAKDPRNLRNKTVAQRMLIVSAGVIMNILLAAVLFIGTYLAGVQEKPAVLAGVEPGGAAWCAGIHSGTEILRINQRVNPWFDDIKPIVFSSSRGEIVELEVRYAGQTQTLPIEPIRGEGMLAPLLGVNPMDGLTLERSKRDPLPPYAPGSIFASAKTAEGQPAFQPGDRIVAMSDPEQPGRLTPLLEGWNQSPGAQFDYYRRLVDLAGQPVSYQLVRHADISQTPVTVVVPPVYRYDLGLRMRMGEIAALRRGGPAEQAGLKARQTEGEEVLAPGDILVSVEVRAPDGTATRYTTDATETAPPDGKTKLVPLDPLTLPARLEEWARSAAPGATLGPVRVTVLRGESHTSTRQTMDLTWDDSYRYQINTGTLPATPIPIHGLGLAYQALAIVNGVEPYAAEERIKPLAERKLPSPAAAAGLQPNDKIVQIKFRPIDHQGQPIEQKFQELRTHHWHFVDSSLQYGGSHSLEIQYEREGEIRTATLTATPDPTTPLPARGLVFAYATRTQQANSALEALEMGAYRTLRAIRMTYQGLYALVFGRLSIKTMSGPFTLASTTYLVAGQDWSHLLLWLALISVNLAVVNFLPIPVLDGGHMVFLIYELFRGKPAPQLIEVILTYLGLAMVLSLMLFVIGLDVWRLFF